MMHASDVVFVDLDVGIVHTADDALPVIPESLRSKLLKDLKRVSAGPSRASPHAESPRA